jgi:hypothetical protein
MRFALCRATNCVPQAGGSSQIHHGYPGRRSLETPGPRPVACLSDEWEDLVDACSQLQPARFGLDRGSAPCWVTASSLSSIETVTD